MNATDDMVLYQSVVDEEFRAMLVADPTVFGSTSTLPMPVEAPEHSIADLALAGADAFDCKTSCSWGVTVLCDKFTN